MFTPVHFAVDKTRRLVAEGGPKPRTRTTNRQKRV
jgi:hypothetical protein